MLREQYFWQKCTAAHFESCELIFARFFLTSLKSHQHKINQLKWSFLVKFFLYSSSKVLCPHRFAGRWQTQCGHKRHAGRPIPQSGAVGVRGPAGAHSDHHQGRVSVPHHGGGAGQISITHNQVCRRSNCRLKDTIQYFWRLSFCFLGSARESPVAWEGEATEGADSNPTNQQSGQENLGSATEEEAKEEQQQPEDEGSNSGVSSEEESNTAEPLDQWSLTPRT